MSETTNRPTAGSVEERQAATVAIDGRRLRGRIPYGEESRDMGGWREVIEPGALRATKLDDLVATVDHAGVPIGRYPTTVELEDRADALHWAVDPPKSRADVLEAVERGDLRAGSWRMVVGRDEWRGDVRHVHEIAELLDVSVVTSPAYPAASVELRNKPTNSKEDVHMDDHSKEDVQNVQEDNEKTEDRSSGGLKVEDRAAEPVSVEQRVREEMLSVRKGENRALSTASTLAPGELSSFLFDRLRAASVALASGISVIATDRDTVTFPRLTVDPSPGWYNEAAAITAGDPTLDSVVATPRKAAHRVEFSNEVLDDSDPSAADVIRDNLVRILGLKLDLGIYEGTGSAPEIRGLKNVAGIGNVSMGVNGAALVNLDPIADAMAQLEAANAQAGALVMHPRTWAAIRKLKDAPSGNNRPLMIDAAGSPSQGIRPSIYGVPVFVSSQLSITETQGTAVNASSIYVYQPDALYLIRRQDVEVELDRSRLFNTDQSEMRGKLRADLVVPNATAVSRILGVIP